MIDNTKPDSQCAVCGGSMWMRNPGWDWFTDSHGTMISVHTACLPEAATSLAVRRSLKRYRQERAAEIKARKWV